MNLTNAYIFKAELNMSSHKNKKVLIIGVDGGTWDILTPAMDQGFMPNLKNLVNTGASGILKSIIPTVTPAAWSCFQTGVNPGQNGVFNFSYWFITYSLFIFHFRAVTQTSHILCVFL